MPISSKVNESRFKAGFYPGNAALVDVGLFLFAGTGFDIKVEQPLAVNQRDAQLFGMSCIDQHSFHGKKGFLSFVGDRKPGGFASAKQDVRAAGPLQQAGRRPDGSYPYGVQSWVSETTADIPPAGGQVEVE